MEFGNYTLVMDIIISMQHLKSCECMVVWLWIASVMKTSSVHWDKQQFFNNMWTQQIYFYFKTCTEFSMAGGYMEAFKNCQNWRVGNCAGMGPCPGQYGICMYVCIGNTHLRFFLQYLTTVHHFQDHFLVYIMYRYMTKTCDLGFKVSWSMDYFLTHSSPYKMCYQLHMQVGKVASNCWTGLLDWPLNLKCVYTRPPPNQMCKIGSHVQQRFLANRVPWNKGRSMHTTVGVCLRHLTEIKLLGWPIGTTVYFKASCRPSIVFTCLHSTRIAC